MASRATANPDMHKLHNGALAPGAESIAKLYKKMGGSVIWQETLSRYL